MSRTIARTAGMSSALEPAAERVGQQLLGHRADEHVGRSSSACRSATTPSTCVPSSSSPDASIGAARVARPPRADRVEVLEREPDRIHQLVAARAHRVRAVLLHLLAHRERLRPSRCCLLSGGTLAGGGGGGVPSRLSRIHLPRTTGDVRSGCDVTRQDAARARAGPCAPRRSPARAGTGCRRRSGSRSAWPAAR